MTTKYWRSFQVYKSIPTFCHGLLVKVVWMVRICSRYGVSSRNYIFPLGSQHPLIFLTSKPKISLFVILVLCRPILVAWNPSILLLALVFQVDAQALISIFFTWTICIEICRLCYLFNNVFTIQFHFLIWEVQEMGFVSQ